MKHGLRTALGAGFLAVTWCAVGSVAEAGTIRLARDGQGDDAYQGLYGGGEFKVTKFTDDADNPVGVPAMGAGVQVAGGVFQTFCLERNEHLNFNTDLNWEYNDEAVLGGIGGGSPDPLDARTAYLYNQFWHGTLSDYDYQLGETHRRVSATALQLAIWYFEEELDAGGGQADLHDEFNANQQANDWVDEANDWLNNHEGAGIGNVRVLNLSLVTREGETLRQDVLVLVPLPSAALLGLGLMSGAGAFGLIRRRRRTLA